MELMNINGKMYDPRKVLFLGNRYDKIIKNHSKKMYKIILKNRKHYERKMKKNNGYGIAWSYCDEYDPQMDVLEYTLKGIVEGEKW